jgi:TRAP-type C4-dicarboxylate transport system permease large subunit
MTNNPVGQLFLAGFLPGLALAGLFMLWIAISSGRDPAMRATVRASWSERWAATRHLVEPLTIFAIVIGSLYAGIATATESAAIGVVVALAFVAGQRKLSWSLLQACFEASARDGGARVALEAPRHDQDPDRKGEDRARQRGAEVFREDRHAGDEPLRRSSPALR